MQVSRVGEECTPEEFWHWRYSPRHRSICPVLKSQGNRSCGRMNEAFIEARAQCVSHSVDNEMRLPQWGTPAEPSRSDRIESCQEQGTDVRRSPSRAQIRWLRSAQRVDREKPRLNELNMLNCRRCRLATRIPSANSLAHRRTKGVWQDESKSRSHVSNWHNGNLLEKSDFPTILFRVRRQGVCRAAGTRTHKRCLPV